MTTHAAQEISGKAPPNTQIGRVVFIAFLGLAAIAWIGIAVAANSRTPGVVGLATSVFGGFFVALLIAAVGGWVALKLSEPRKPYAPEVMSADEVGGEMHAILTDLERYRQDIAQQVKERSAWRVPACAGVGLCAWTLLALTGAPGEAMDFIVVIIVGGFIGYFWSMRELSLQYEKLYRERVLPRLAASFGEITWRNAVMPDLARLKAEHVFRNFGEAIATNELAGTYRGLPINIVAVLWGALMAINLAWPREEVYGEGWLRWMAFIFIGIVVLGGLAWFWVKGRHQVGTLPEHMAKSTDSEQEKC